jgi:hypothetical protein
VSRSWTSSTCAAVRCGAHQRKELERLCRYITRPAIANERLKRNPAGQVVLQLKESLPRRRHPYRDVAPGAPAAPGRTGSASQAAYDSLPWRARTPRQAARCDRGQARAGDVVLRHRKGKRKRPMRRFARLRGIATVKMSTDQIMALTRGRGKD